VDAAANKVSISQTKHHHTINFR